MNATERRIDRQRIEEEAASLVVALSEIAGPEAERRALRWASRSPTHGVALAQAEATWRQSERLRAALAVHSEVPHRPGRQPWSRLRVDRRSAIAGVVAIAASVAFVCWERLPEDFSTRRGERRTVRLADGSTIALNTDTRIEVLLRREQRTVRLIRGEAMFDVAHDASRPFVVDTGLAGLRVLGTAFNVRVRQQTVELTVTRGLVGVQQGNAPMRQVPASTLATIRPSAVTIASVPPVGVAQRTAWQAGKIELDGETLTEAVNEFNRYLDHPLVIGDPELASIRLGGTFATGDANRFTSALEASFGIHAIRLNDGSTVLLRAD